ncbi:SdpI family protein [Paenarthrobacter sp. NPDC089675]|uniref:SdpI family protein n=1 Tax=Paenarthrobacter sp. NPDC089675 TaxID=3364376 RepID=UPI0037F6EF3F
MSGEVIGIVVALSLLGLTLMTGGILALIGRLPYNPVVGIRMASTMRSKAAWKAGHRSAGPYLLISGLSALAGAAAAVVMPKADPLALGLIPAAAVVVMLVIAAVVASRSALLVPYAETD